MNDRSIKTTLDLDAISSFAILDSLPDGAYVTDTDRKILFWNREAERITGWQRCDVVGHRCHENILCHVDKDGHLLCGHEHCPLHRAMATGTQSDLPLLVFAKRQDGARIPVEVTVSPIRNNRDEVIGGIEIFRDLSPTFQDLDRARLIQQDSLGMNLPVDARLDIRIRYTPHDLVGGDFYRVECLQDNLYGILVADVVGHGVPAALYSMQLRCLWEDGRKHLNHPAEFLRWLSQRVEKLTDTDAGYFATAVYATYEAGTGFYEVATAGHPAPVLIRHDGRMEQLSSTGPGLGLLPHPHFHAAGGVLEPRDHLLFFTDGAYEITDAEGAELGEHALFQMIRDALLVRGAKALPAIEESLLRYCHRMFLPDDLTLIDLQRTQQT